MSKFENHLLDDKVLFRGYSQPQLPVYDSKVEQVVSGFSFRYKQA